MRLRRLHLLAITLLATLTPMMPFTEAHAAIGTQPYVGFRKHTTAADFAGSVTRGVLIAERDGVADVRLAGTGRINGRNANLYGVAKYQYGTLTSPILDARYPFDTAIGSWNATTPAGTWVQLELRAFRAADQRWTRFYNLGFWAADTGAVKRRSVGNQRDAYGSVSTDTLLLRGDPVWTRYQFRVSLFTTKPEVSPSVRLVSIMTSDTRKQPAGVARESDRQAWGVELNVPQRSQMIYPGGGEVWCSPTTVSMALAYWGVNVPVPYAAEATYDYAYKGNGNWPFNTAWAAAENAQLEAFVTRFSSMAQVEEWISAGVPVIMSYAYRNGELPGTPLKSSNGHIQLIRGFDANGNVIVNDPAFPSDATVRVVYDRAILERLWLERAGGTVYLIYPRGRTVPNL